MVTCTRLEANIGKEWCVYDGVTSCPGGVIVSHPFTCTPWKPELSTGFMGLKGFYLNDGKYI